jgi:ELWxxDGT repeat protein
MAHASSTNSKAEVRPATTPNHKRLAKSPSFWFEGFSGMTLFEVDNTTLGEQLWRTNGTTAGTTLVADIPAQDPNPSPVTSAVHRLGLGSDFFFAAHGTTVGTELYVLTGDRVTTKPPPKE